MNSTMFNCWLKLFSPVRAPLGVGWLKSWVWQTTACNWQTQNENLSEGQAENEKGKEKSWRPVTAENKGEQLFGL